MRHPLTMILIGATVPMMAVAQVSPAPARPAPEPRPAVEPRPAPRAPSLISPKFEYEFDLEHLKAGALGLRHLAEDAARLHVDNFRFDADLLRQQAEEMRVQAKEFARVDVERLQMDAEHLRMDSERLRMEALEGARFTLTTPMKFDFDFGPGFGSSEKFLEAKPRKAWAAEDPADSLYRIARETLIRGEYRRAAQLFNEIPRRFPKSSYVVDCTYWEAFARYRSGSTEDLKQALRILDEGRTTLAQLRTNSDAQVDVQALRTRVQAALAARGDEQAAAALRREAVPQQSGCDPEEMAVKAEALSALGQMDAASAIPVVKKVLARRDECTRELRRRALYVVGRQGGPEAASIILDVAKNDTDANLRGEAMRWLPRVAGDNAIPQLEELLRTSTDESAQRAVISALGSMDSDRARRAIRTIVERADASERIRYDAIVSLSRERDGRAPSNDDLAYIRSLYAKMESPRLKEAVLVSAGRVETAENQQFLLGIVRNQSEVPALRATALQRAGRMESVGVADIAKLYDVADTRSLREQILRALSQRKENEAVLKMIEIARRDTDPQIRRSAINLLSRSNNEEAKKFIREIFEQ